MKQFENLAYTQVFDEGTIHRGKAYARQFRAKISSEETQDGSEWTVSSTIEGESRYRVSVVVAALPTSWLLKSGHCNCQQKRDCKHAVAVACEFVDRQNYDLPSLPAVRTGADWDTKRRSVMPSAVPSLILASDPNRHFAWTLRAASFGQHQLLGFNIVKLKAAATTDEIFRRMAEKADFMGLCPVEGREGGNLLMDAVISGRCRWMGEDRKVVPGFLTIGPVRSVEYDWTLDESGEQIAEVRCGSTFEEIVAIGDDLFYFDLDTLQVGRLDPESEIDDISLMLEVPPVSPDEAPAIIKMFAKMGVKAPAPQDPSKWQRIEVSPVPRLSLSRPDGADPLFGVPRMNLEFEYSGHRFPVDGREVVYLSGDGKPQVVIRNPAAEREASEKLNASRSVGYVEFVKNSLEDMKSGGWDVSMEGYEIPKLIEAEDWEAEFRDTRDPGGISWFSFGIMATIDGVGVEMSTILKHAMRQSLKDATHLYLPLPDGRILTVLASRIRPLVEAMSLVSRTGGGAPRSRLDIAADLAAAADAAGVRVRGGDGLGKLAVAFASGKFSDIAPPPGFRGTLRPYQAHGAGWLGLLFEFSIGGILAFDMGLGKTATALYHICAVKASGLLKRPVIVVAPVTVMSVWRDEAAVFAPGLKVFIWHGLGRGSLSRLPPDTDIVVTSYATLARNVEEVAVTEWGLAILDEAQNIKNPESKASMAAARIRARQHLALTGTPVENRLGDLWSIFRYAEPSVLGSRESFERDFARPIERGGDPRLSKSLSRRLMPFIMRRTKDEVASDLPPKVDTVVRVDLGPEQARLYEAVRATTQASVRQVMAEKGMDAGGIFILNALTRLRQVCLDHRLVKMAHEGMSEPSAKLVRLVEILKEAVSEGRKVLVFSQFTSMLDLIAPELEKEGLHHIVLTGQSKHREKLVSSFQSGEADVFLISLKAGGVGITLTEADVVIHFDPWWNPAVENQATDRAHRIGQTKTVFVNRLIARDTIEEAILELQEKKRAIAASIYSEDAEVLSALTEADIMRLFSVSPVSARMGAEPRGRENAA